MYRRVCVCDCVNQQANKRHLPLVFYCVIASRLNLLVHIKWTVGFSETTENHSNMSDGDFSHRKPISVDNIISINFFPIANPFIWFSFSVNCQSLIKRFLMCTKFEYMPIAAATNLHQIESMKLKLKRKNTKQIELSGHTFVIFLASINQFRRHTFFPCFFSLRRMVYLGSMWYYSFLVQKSKHEQWIARLLNVRGIFMFTPNKTNAQKKTEETTVMTINFARFFVCFKKSSTNSEVAREKTRATNTLRIAYSKVTKAKKNTDEKKMFDCKSGFSVDGVVSPSYILKQLFSVRCVPWRWYASSSSLSLS